jgi:hypothetical protein
MKTPNRDRFKGLANPTRWIDFLITKSSMHHVFAIAMTHTRVGLFEN